MGVGAAAIGALVVLFVVASIICAGIFGGILLEENNPGCAVLVWGVTFFLMVFIVLLIGS